MHGLPRVAAARQPWALSRNALGVHRFLATVIVINRRTRSLEPSPTHAFGSAIAVHATVPAWLSVSLAYVVNVLTAQLRIHPGRAFAQELLQRDDLFLIAGGRNRDIARLRERADDIQDFPTVKISVRGPGEQG